MAIQFNRKSVLQSLCTRISSVCDKVYTDSRPTATDQMDAFVVVRLPQGIRPYADTHHTCYVQAVCYARDRQGGVENVDAMDALINGIVGLYPFDDTLVSTIDAPMVLDCKSDTMGFHSTIIQFKLIIKV